VEGLHWAIATNLPSSVGSHSTRSANARSETTCQSPTRRCSHSTSAGSRSACSRIRSLIADTAPAYAGTAGRPRGRPARGRSAPGGRLPAAGRGASVRVPPPARPVGARRKPVQLTVDLTFPATIDDVATMLADESFVRWRAQRSTGSVNGVVEQADVTG